MVFVIGLTRDSGLGCGTSARTTRSFFSHSAALERDRRVFQTATYWRFSVPGLRQSHHIYLCTFRSRPHRLLIVPWGSRLRLTCRNLFRPAAAAACNSNHIRQKFRQNPPAQRQQLLLLLRHLLLPGFSDPLRLRPLQACRHPDPLCRAGQMCSCHRSCQSCRHRLRICLASHRGLLHISCHGRRRQPGQDPLCQARPTPKGKANRQRPSSRRRRRSRSRSRRCRSVHHRHRQHSNRYRTLTSSLCPS